MTLPQTESTDMKVCEELGWKIMSLNVPILIVDVDPPAESTDFKSGEPEDWQPIGGFELIRASDRHVIDTLTHQTLLEQSLREFADIWRTLAER